MNNVATIRVGKRPPFTITCVGDIKATSNTMVRDAAHILQSLAVPVGA